MQPKIILHCGAGKQKGWITTVKVNLCAYFKTSKIEFLPIVRTLEI